MKHLEEHSCQKGAIWYQAAYKSFPFARLYCLFPHKCYEVTVAMTTFVTPQSPPCIGARRGEWRRAHVVFCFALLPGWRPLLLGWMPSLLGFFFLSFSSDEVSRTVVSCTTCHRGLVQAGTFTSTSISNSQKDHTKMYVNRILFEKWQVTV